MKIPSNKFTKIPSNKYLKMSRGVSIGLWNLWTKKPIKSWHHRSSQERTVKHFHPSWTTRHWMCDTKMLTWKYWPSNPEKLWWNTNWIHPTMLEKRCLDGMLPHLWPVPCMLLICEPNLQNNMKSRNQKNQKYCNGHTRPRKCTWIITHGYRSFLQNRC